MIQTIYNDFKSRMVANKFYLLCLLPIFFLASAYGSPGIPIFPFRWLAVLLVMIWGLILYLPKKLPQAIVVIILTLGSVSAVLAPINDIPDEYVHYARSHYLADGNLNLSNDFEELQLSKDVVAIDKQDHQAILGNDTTIEHTEETVSYPTLLMTNVYYNISYIPQALGLIVADVFNLNIIHSYLLGRLFNVLAYAGLVALAIVLSLKAAQLIAFSALIPMNIYLAGSYNQDTVSTGLMFVTLALFFRFLQQKNITPKQIAIYTLLCGMLAVTKLPFILFIGLLFFIPQEYWSTKSFQTWMLKLSAIVLIVGLGAIWYKLSGQLKSPFHRTADFIKTTNPGRQIQKMLEDPVVYTFSLTRNVSNYLLSWNSVNSYGILNYGTSWLSSLMMIFFSAVIVNNANVIKVPKWMRFGMLIISLGIAFGISLALFLSWTPVGNLEVLGVQGRYFIGLYPLLALLLAANNKSFSKFQGSLSEKSLLVVSIYFITTMLISIVFRYYVY